MRVWVSLVILLGLAVGLYFHVVAFDPLSLIILVYMIWNNHVNFRRQQELADIISKSHNLLSSGIRETVKKLDEVRKRVT